ncbi:MAG: flavodoxin-dependent (E)-4-hydroxy-3-methylbut-2-enyl-diphosphate synthase [bacterium]|nr:flavodoxin-dependent (E)-4-hydroxy-3-methylbut-2-enyl-diphosphate synthase [bacterium]
MTSPSTNRKTRPIRVGTLTIGGGGITVQSMAATRTQDVEATLRQIEILEQAGADLIRIAVDSKADVIALEELSRATDIPISVDLQENYRLADAVGPFVQKVRYNPGHLHHHEKGKSAQEKAHWLADIARKHDMAIRIGCNAGSMAPEYGERYGKDDVTALVEQAKDHCAYMDEVGFTDYLVSIKDSDPRLVIEANQRFAAARPDVPLHLGVTEAGMPPDGIIKTRIAFEQLISQGIGDTIRVSLTVPFENKGQEIEVGRELLSDIAAGRFRSVPKGFFDGLNIIACPSCSRVENEKFIELAEQVKEATTYAAEQNVTIAVMGCRVNGPGETDDADLGLWCGPTSVNLKKGPQTLGNYPYDEVLPALLTELKQILAS